jgi:periplasmic protein TonB
MYRSPTSGHAFRELSRGGGFQYCVRLPVALLAVLWLAGCSSPTPPQPRPRPAVNAPSQRIVVGDWPQGARLLRHVRPIYPPEARKQRIEGTVKLRVVIGKTGAIQDVTVLDGPPIFIPESLRAVRQWRYTPTSINGEAVEVITEVHFDFNPRQ